MQTKEKIRKFIESNLIVFDDDTKFSGMLGAAFEERSDQDRFTPLLRLNIERNISADDKINLATAYTEAGWQLKLEAVKKF